MMRGHWLSGTRKLNRHYQSGSGGSYHTWEREWESTLLSGFQTYGVSMFAGSVLDYDPDYAYNFSLGDVEFYSTQEVPRQSGNIVKPESVSPEYHDAFRILMLEFYHPEGYPTQWLSRQYCVYGGLGYGGNSGMYIPVEGGTFPIKLSVQQGYDWVWVDTGYNANVIKLENSHYKVTSNFNQRFGRLQVNMGIKYPPYQDGMRFDTFSKLGWYKR